METDSISQSGTEGAELTGNTTIADGIETVDGGDESAGANVPKIPSVVVEDTSVTRTPSKVGNKDFEVGWLQEGVLLGFEIGLCFHKLQFLLSSSYFLFGLFACFFG